MGSEFATKPAMHYVEELSLADLKIVKPATDPMSLEANADSIVALDLGMFSFEQASQWLRSFADAGLNGTVVVLGTATQIGQAQTRLGQFDVTYLEKPTGVQDIRDFLYGRLADIYRPFRRTETQFVPKEASLEVDPRPRPMVSEIDPAYARPPMAFNPDEHDQLMSHLQKPETEERTD